jgi:tetratricopeptide (TPR) repeat protein
MYLSIHDGAEFESSVELSPDREFRIGRAADNDIVLDDADKSVSRYHAQIRQENDEWVILDLNSPNGVWIDQQRVTRTVLRPGMSILIGPYHLSVNENEDETGHVPVETAYTHVVQPPVQQSAPLPAPLPAVNAAPPPSVPSPQPRPPQPRRVSPAVLVGALIAVLLVLIVAVSLRSQIRRNREQARNPQPPVGSTPGSTQGPPPQAAGGGEPKPGLRSNQVQSLIADARSKIDAGSLQEAAATIQKALDLDSSNEDALRLKSEIDARLASPPSKPPPAETPPVLPPGVPRPVQLEHEPNKVYISRANRYYDEWKRAGQALDRGDPDAALEALKGVPDDDKLYPDKAAWVLRARGLQTAARAKAAQERLTAAKDREGAGDLAQALQMYQQLVSDANESVAAEAKQRAVALTGTIDERIKAAYLEAHNLSLGETSESKQRMIDAYRRVLSLTQPGDGRRSEAEQRLKVIGGG